MLIRATIFSGVALFGAGAVAMKSYDKATNYVQVQGKILSLTETCYLEKRSGKTREYSNTGDCKLMEMMAEVHPAWKGFDLIRSATINLSYQSPVDKRFYKKTFTDVKPDPKTKLFVGGKYPLLASKKKADEARNL